MAAIIFAINARERLAKRARRALFTGTPQAYVFLAGEVLLLGGWGYAKGAMGDFQD